MDLQSIVSEMEGNAQAIRALVVGCSDHQARWRPDAASWSGLEVINHLLDEEREDFRSHLDQALHRRDQTWSPIDPGRWVLERGYDQRDPEESLSGFLSAREDSLVWLRGLGRGRLGCGP